MARSRDLADSGVVINTLDSVRSDVQTQLDGKQGYNLNLTDFVGAFSLPITDGSNGQVLSTNGEGTLSFIDGSDPNALTSSDIGVTVQPYNANILTSSDIGVTVQPYVTGILTESDIGSLVQDYDLNLTDFLTEFTLPIVDGSSGQVLQTNGLGTLSFVDVAAGSSYGDSDVDAHLNTSNATTGQTLTWNGSDYAWNTGAGAGGGSFNAIASGSLSDGSIVIINNDGTVSVAGEVSQVAGPGTPVVFENASIEYTSATFDSANNKVVIAYRDEENSYYGTAIVGTVSGTSISFGSPVVFESASTTYISTTFDSENNKVVIAYRDQGNSYYGTAIVGTVSGTSISFGSPVVFKSATTTHISATFDSANNKIVIAYSATYGRGIVGTVSGTSISFGSEWTFVSSTANDIRTTFDSNSNKIVISYKNSSNYLLVGVGTVSGTSISFGSFSSLGPNKGVGYVTFDSANNKIVIAYTDLGNSYSGTAAVGTVSGTSISFGTPVVFKAGSTTAISTTFDSNSNKIVISYKDSSNLYYDSIIVGTVSDTSISFGSPYIFSTTGIVSISTYFYSATFDSENNKVVIAYADRGNSEYGTAVVFDTLSEIVANLTAENYVGISNAAYSDGSTATIQTVGSIDDAQSGLTAGQAYYVQANGALGLTPDTPSVFAGTAVSATSLLIGKEAPAVDLSSGGVSTGKAIAMAMIFGG